MTGVQSRGSGRHSWLSGGHLSSPGTGFAASVLDERLEPDQISANLPAIETQSFADLFDQTGGRRIGRDPATISRELRRNAATRSGKQEYRALVVTALTEIPH